MRFLCLHGQGTNATIFKSQMARIMSYLDPDHVFIFVNGPVPYELAPGLNLLGWPENGKYYRYAPEDDRTGHLPRTVKGLNRMIATLGPFDGVIGFSEGGLVASGLMVREALGLPDSNYGFKCGVFFSAPPPIDERLARQGVVEARHHSYSTDGVLINVPTAHIWSDARGIHQGMGQELVELCDEALREEAVHGLGHTVPGAYGDEGLKDALRAIERVIERAKDMYGYY